MIDLTGKVAFVTGAAGRKGIGHAIAVRLAERGANVAVNDLRPSESRRQGLQDLVAEIEGLGARSIAVYGDVADSAEVERMFAQLAVHLGRLDIMVNNAAAPSGPDRVPLVDLQEEHFDRVQRVNVRGTYLCCRAAARQMLAQREGGRIINISSVIGKHGVALYAAYAASKFAIRGLTQSLAHELGPDDITVNAICPGLTESERVDDLAHALHPSNVTTGVFRREIFERAIRENSLKRVGKTGDIADAAAFLASDYASYITGQSLVVDGGHIMD
ncbi:MAG: 3-oxoacyl-ACP reductase FabG [Chloroflexota bacterium]|nr:3-oxoacyl-ACP reductase FabG [Chloroflexota bacterium]MDE2908755.1 3-oxoacyl-ACP reductase FabG [Chloroflexota bacterium]